MFDFTVTAPVPLPVGAVVQLTVPPEISIYSDAGRTQLILRSGAGYAPLIGWEKNEKEGDELFPSPHTDMLPAQTVPRPF